MSVDREQLLEAMRAAHAFPGFYPITLICRNDPTVAVRLEAAIVYHQEGAPYTIERIPSSKASYMSWRITLHVDDAEQALERKDALRAVDGVMVML